METILAIMAGLITALIAAAVVGIWKLYGQVATLAERVDLTIKRIDDRESRIDARLDRVEADLYRRPPGIRGAG